MGLILYDTMASFLLTVLTEYARVVRLTFRRSYGYETNKSWVYVN